MPFIDLVACVDKQEFSAVFKSCEYVEKKLLQRVEWFFNEM